MLARSHVLASIVAMSLAAAGCGNDGLEDGSTGGGSAVSSATSTATTVASTSIGTTTGAGGEDACGPEGVTFVSEACSACLDDRCCAERAACGGVPECLALTQCWDACAGDLDCLASCPVLPTPPVELLELQLCQASQCLEPCQMDRVPCELVKVAVGAPDQAACDACAQESCCDEYEAQDPVEMLSFYLCNLQCLDAQCLRDCELAWPGAVEIQEAVLECGFGDACGASCVHDPGCGVFGFNGPDDCSDCLEASCCEVHERCSFDIECIDFFTCRAGCHDQASCLECLELWPAETAGLGSAMFACGEVVCGDACGGTENCGVIPGLLSLSCLQCVQGSCCDPSRACAADPDCAALQICVELCEGDEACDAACRADLPAGADLLEPLETCKIESCADDCP